jgi:hypothetical protein
MIRESAPPGPRRCAPCRSTGWRHYFSRKAQIPGRPMRAAYRYGRCPPVVHFGTCGFICAQFTVKQPVPFAGFKHCQFFSNFRAQNHLLGRYGRRAFIHRKKRSAANQDHLTSPEEMHCPAVGCYRLATIDKPAEKCSLNRPCSN